jgi:hypothetical protein
MRDPVALAWSGRIDEAKALACEQAGSKDSMLAAQGLEALAVLGSEHGLTASEEIDRLLVSGAKGSEAASRRAFEAAMALGSRAVEPLVCERLGSGDVRWELLRYTGEMPSQALAKALAEGWSSMPGRYLDEALLTSCVLPCATPAEAVQWGARAIACAADRSESVRVASMRAIRSWAPAGADHICAAALDDESDDVRREAARTLAWLHPDALLQQAEERGPECVEVWNELTAEQKKRLEKPGKKTKRR